jgi:hypothetical protein
VDAQVGWWSCTSGICLKVGCSGPSSMVGRIWFVGWLSDVCLVGSCGGTSSECKRWFDLLGGIVRLFLSLEHDGRLMLG